MSTKERIKFTCPRCVRSHSRGYIDGVSIFRCLNCGYVGHGFHADEETDAGIAEDIRAGQRYNVSVGLEPGAFEP